MSEVLSFDLGATSARGVVFSLSNGVITEKKIYRFKDYQFINAHNHIFWNIEKIISEIKRIITLASFEFTIKSIGFDTYGCDFGLLDENGKLLMDPLCYQTMLLEENLHYGMDLPPIFQEKTGIPNASINSSSQLLYMKENYPTLLKKARHLLMMPDLIQYLLTGSILSESSIASTSQLFDIDKQQWAVDLIELLGISSSLFSTIVLPYTQIGSVILNNQTILIHSVMEHDTASAIFALPSNDHSCFFLSSGTWSVLGEKSEKGILIRKPLDPAYSYEQAGDGKILKLKNMLGMWFIEEALSYVNQSQQLTIHEIQEMLLDVKPINFFFDSQNSFFLNKGQFVPRLLEYGLLQDFDSINEPQNLFLTVYQNLAFKYAETIENLSSATSFNNIIYLFGGGSKSKFLNQLTATLTNSTIAVCYSENSALGNALAQFLALEEISDRKELISIVKENYPLTYFYPDSSKKFRDSYSKYKKFIGGTKNELS